MTTGLELAQAWEAWLSHVELPKSDTLDWMPRRCPRCVKLWTTARALNAAVLAENRQYAEDAVRLSGEFSAGALGQGEST